MLFSRERGGATSAALHWEIDMEGKTSLDRQEPWNKGKLVGQKAPFKSKEIWAIRVRLQLAERSRELALFNLGIDSKLRACDLTALRVRDICHGNQVSSRAIVLQRKTRRPVQFEITATTREALQGWIRKAGLQSGDFLFPSRRNPHDHIGTHQYARVVHGWVKDLGLDPAGYGTHSMRRTKASLTYKRTKNLRAVQLLLGHSKIESTVRFLGIEVDDAVNLEVGRDCSPSRPPTFRPLL
jgi:integrase